MNTGCGIDSIGRIKCTRDRERKEEERDPDVPARRCSPRAIERSPDIGRNVFSQDAMKAPRRTRLNVTKLPPIFSTKLEDFDINVKERDQFDHCCIYSIVFGFILSYVLRPTVPLGR